MSLGVAGGLNEFGPIVTGNLLNPWRIPTNPAGQAVLDEVVIAASVSEDIAIIRQSLMVGSAYGADLSNGVFGFALLDDGIRAGSDLAEGAVVASAQADAQVSGESQASGELAGDAAASATASTSEDEEAGTVGSSGDDGTLSTADVRKVDE